VHDLPTPFDPDLLTKLDPQLAEELRVQGFRVTGYRLELVGYRDSEGDRQQPAAVAHDAGVRLGIGDGAGE